MLFTSWFVFIVIILFFNVISSNILISCLKFFHIGLIVLHYLLTTCSIRSTTRESTTSWIYMHFMCTKDIATFLYMISQNQAIPVTGREGPYGCEMSRVPHFLDNWLTDGGEVVSPMHQPPFTPRKIPGTHFFRGWIDPRSIVWPEGLGKLKNPVTSSGIARDLLACSVVPQPTMLLHALIWFHTPHNIRWWGQIVMLLIM
jgi:hypothetical protein